MKNHTEEIIEEEWNGLRGSGTVFLVIFSIVGGMIYIFDQNPGFSVVNIILLSLLMVVVIARIASSLIIIRKLSKK